ncbi:hypothetical protein [Nocardia flavorosea]|nr:hypothetical protein [Nocardia flavorosea]
MRKLHGTFPVPADQQRLAARPAPPRAAIVKKALPRHSRRGGR